MPVPAVFRRLKVVRLFAWFFWLSMLVGHAPLWLRAGHRLVEGGTAQNWTSFLTLTVSSLFFIYKLMGLRVFPARPSWQRTVVYCVLGAVVHVLIFCPSLTVDRFELVAILSAPITVVLLSIASLGSVLRNTGLPLSTGRGKGAWADVFRRRYQHAVFIEAIRPLLDPVPVTVQSHRGPPVSVHVH